MAVTAHRVGTNAVRFATPNHHAIIKGHVSGVIWVRLWITALTKTYVTVGIYANSCVRTVLMRVAPSVIITIL
jgi:hypothetical protein